MPVNIPGGFMHCILPFQLALASKPFSTTIAVSVDAAFDPADAIAALDTAWRTCIVGITDSNYTIEPAVGYYRTGGGGLQLVTSNVAAQAGTQSQASSPPNVTVVVRKRTALVGRSQRGRMFLPIGIGETAVDEVGNIAPATQTAINTRFATWRASVVGAPSIGDMYLLHSDPTKAPSAITSFVTQPIVRTQRRRLPRG